MAKTGRPRKEIDVDNFKKLCGMMCTLSEIAGFFDCSEDTIERWCKRELGDTFAETFKRYSANGKITLRRNQFKLSEKNAAMAIFLGKNYLGQTDKIEQILSEVEDLTPLSDMLK
jgi:AraC-like DNA-binding protein